MALPRIAMAGGGERAQYLLHDYNDNTIRFLLRYPGAVDPDALCAAARALVESVDILHGTFFTDGVSAYWHINEAVEESFYFQYVEAAGEPTVTARSLALLPVPPGGRAQLRCTMVQGGNACAVVVCISHLCVDGGDGKYLLNKLVEAYDRIVRTGTADGLEMKNGSRAPEKVYEKLSWKDVRSLMDLPSVAPTAYPFPTEEPGRARMVQAGIPAAVMDAARARARGAGATANDLLLTAFYRAYAALPEVDAAQAMSISSMMDLRRHCKGGESEGLCNMSGALPTTLAQGVRGSFEDTLAEVAAQTRAQKEDPLAGLSGLPLMHGMVRAVPVGLMLAAVGRIYGNPSVGLTNLGSVRADSLALGSLVPDGMLMGGPLKKKPGMQVAAISLNGACSLCAVGQLTQADADHLQATLDRLVAGVEAYAAQ